MYVWEGKKELMEGRTEYGGVDGRERGMYEGKEGGNMRKEGMERGKECMEGRKGEGTTPK